MQFLSDLLAASSQVDNLKDLKGIALPSLAIVVSSDDPEGLMRVKVTYANGQRSDWCPVVMPAYGIYTDPIPEGATVLVVFSGGDPATPVVLGTLVNRVNPPAYGNGLRVTQDVSLLGESVAIHENQVATIGAVDTDGDVINDKGWT